MPDEGSENESSFDISKSKAIDESNTSKATEISKRFDEANPSLKAMRDALDTSGLSAAAKPAQNISAQLDPLREQIAKMEKITAPAREMAERLKATGLHEHVERMAKIAAPAREITDRLKATGIHDRLGDISARAGAGSRLADAIRGIEKQQGLLDDLTASTHERTIPTIPDIPVIENPIVETNRKLDRIEKQFSQISVIARDSAQVATDLQAYAAEFLQKFEKAAEDANQSGSKAIKVGWLALAIAIVVGAGQIFAPTLIRDQEAETLRQTVVDLNAEVATLRAEQSAANDRLIEALANSDQATASAIAEAIATIAAQQLEAGE